MPVNHKESAFEAAIEGHLLAHDYRQGNPAAFDAERGLDADTLFEFIETTQKGTWKALTAFLGDKTRIYLLDELQRAIQSQGMLAVFRHGFKCHGKSIRLAYFRPANRLNPETLARYDRNILTVTRQVRFSPIHPEQSIDLLLSVNGLPLITAELKNPFSGQTLWDAIRQYQRDRDPRELLFQFNRRALAHFAVDTNLVYMTTRLEGTSTFFLPFNQGCNGGGGNPPGPEGRYATAYLWERIWQRDSLLDILGRFLHLEVEEKDIEVKRNGQTIKRKVKKERLIFPRFHQIDAVRDLCRASAEHGPGRQYLVQHSAGSGKSNTIAWLAHRLANLHDANDAKVFDTVVVITDRRVLDKQLQDTIYQFEHKQGVVKKIDDNTEQLARALSDGTPIVVSTLQKFPFISQTLERLNQQGKGIAIDTAGKCYAVIVDEAHSSQSGETSKELKAILADAEIRGKAEALAAEGIEDSEDEAVLLTMLKRGRQPNISFFAFTATPKYKTLKIFDEPGADGLPPFHRYTMKQAIEEEFIHDVLKNYLTYGTYYRLVQSGADRIVEKKAAGKAMARFRSLHPHNIAQKVEVMVEHFRAVTRHKIGGRAKAMVVTDSREAAVRYKLAFDEYISGKGYEIRTLVAFSGSIDLPEAPGASYTEAGMNGMGEKELPAAFATQAYQLLLVAEKYQTGFDQPLLHTMYVDKRLDGVQAVQTLSRLNRTCPGKEDTFVLDFRNKREGIFKAFKPYYEVSAADELVSSQKLYELKKKLDDQQVYHLTEVDDFCRVFFKDRGSETLNDHPRLNQIADLAVERFKTLTAEQRDEFRDWLASYRNLYGFLAQVMPFADADLEKLYTYGRFLATKLSRKGRDKVELGEDVKLKFYKLQKESEGAIRLGIGEAPPLKGPVDVGTGSEHKDMVALSSLVEHLNKRFGTAFTAADQLFFDQVTSDAVAREDLKAVASANAPDAFRLVFDRELDGIFIDRMDGNSGIFRRVMEDEAFRRVVADHLVQQVYGTLRGETSTAP